jgi:hypothetical protein
MCEDNLAGRLSWAKNDPVVRDAVRALAQAVRRADHPMFDAAKWNLDQTIVDKQIRGEVPRGAFTIDPLSPVHRRCKGCGDMRNKDVFVPLPGGGEQCTVCEIRQGFGGGAWYHAHSFDLED